MDLDEPGYGIADYGIDPTLLDHNAVHAGLDPIFYEASEEEICWLCSPASAHPLQECPYRIIKDDVPSGNASQMSTNCIQDEIMTSDSSGIADSDGDHALSSVDETMATSWSDSSLPDAKTFLCGQLINEANVEQSLHSHLPTSQGLSAGSVELSTDQQGKATILQTVNRGHDLALTVRQIRRLEAEKTIFELENCFPTDVELAHIAALAELPKGYLCDWFLEHLDIQYVLAAPDLVESSAMLTPRPTYDLPNPAPVVPVLDISQAVAEAAQSYIDSCLDKSCASGQTRRAANNTSASAYGLRCPECPAAFKNNNRWLRHMSKRYPQTLWYCHLCAFENGKPYIHHRNDKFLEHLLQSHGLTYEDALEARNQWLVPVTWYQSAFPAVCPFEIPCNATFRSWDDFQVHWRSHFSDRLSSIDPKIDPPGDDNDSDDDNDHDDNNDNSAKGRGKRSKPRRQFQTHAGAVPKSTKTNRTQSKTTGRSGNKNASRTSSPANSDGHNHTASDKVKDVWRWLDTIPALGKSEVALEFVHRHREDFDAILWVEASSTTQLRLCFDQLAWQLGLFPKFALKPDAGFLEHQSLPLMLKGQSLNGMIGVSNIENEFNLKHRSSIIDLGLPHLKAPQRDSLSFCDPPQPSEPIETLCASPIHQQIYSTQQNLSDVSLRLESYYTFAIESMSNVGQQHTLDLTPKFSACDTRSTFGLTNHTLPQTLGAWANETNTRKLRFSKAHEDTTVSSTMAKLSARDHAFIIDDSAAMSPRWSNVTEMINLLAYIVEQEDPDGLELRFAHPRWEKLQDLYIKKTTPSRLAKLHDPRNIGSDSVPARRFIVTFAGHDDFQSTAGLIIQFDTWSQFRFGAYMKLPESGTCTSKSSRSREKLPLYPEFVSSANPGADWRLCRVVRATSAAPTYFKSWSSGEQNYTFFDGAFGQESASPLACCQVTSLHPEYIFSIPVSIGTGRMTSDGDLSVTYQFPRLLQTLDSPGRTSLIGQREGDFDPRSDYTLEVSRKAMGRHGLRAKRETVSSLSRLHSQHAHPEFFAWEKCRMVLEEMNDSTKCIPLVKAVARRHVEAAEKALRLLNRFHYGIHFGQFCRIGSSVDRDALDQAMKALAEITEVLLHLDYVIEALDIESNDEEQRNEEQRNMHVGLAILLLIATRQQASLGLIPSEPQASRSRSKSALHHGALCLPGYGIGDGSGADDDEADHNDE